LLNHVHQGTDSAAVGQGFGEPGRNGGGDAQVNLIGFKLQGFELILRPLAGQRHAPCDQKLRGAGSVGQGRRAVKARL
jgi:hypothetical protein